jgi:hypothetical protein
MTKEKKLTMSVPEAGTILGISPNAAYQAACRGEIPCIQIGRLKRVPVAAMERMLAEAGRAPKVAA